MDAEKQDAINVFLGHYQPQLGKPALWELDSDQHYNVGSRGSNIFEENTRAPFKRSMSDGNILCEASSSIRKNEESEQSYPEEAQDSSKGLSESSPEISTFRSDSSYLRYTPSMSHRQLFVDGHSEDYPNGDHIFYNKRLDSFNCSNFLDVDWLSSSGNSCEDETYERSTLIGSPIGGQSSENMVRGMCRPTCDSESCVNAKGQEQGGRSLTAGEYPDGFVKWVMNEGMFP